MNPSPSRPPEHEPGGDRMMIIVALVVITALAGIGWSFFSRQGAPHDAPPTKPFYLPPSAKPQPAPAAVPPAPTVPPPR